MTKRKGRLVFEDGTSFEGWMAGFQGEATGEVRFDSSVVGYLERITDPENAGAILVMGMPQIGNYGVNQADVQSEEGAAVGIVVREMCLEPSSWRAQESLADYLRKNEITALDGVDTRAVSLYLRENPGASGSIEFTESEVL